MSDAVDHPAYYGGKDNPYEAIKVIESLGLGYAFCLGNVIKYAMRAGKKTDDPIKDLDKAKWYLERASSNWETEDILKSNPGIQAHLYPFEREEFS